MIHSLDPINQGRTEITNGGERGLGTRIITEVPASPRVEAIYKKVGDQTVLIPYKWGAKIPMRKKWQETKLEDTRASDYVRDLEQNNIGILVGRQSGGLSNIDCDTDEFRDALLRADPNLYGQTLTSKGARGCSFWFRLTGEYPDAVVKIRNSKGEDVGEFRGGKGCSIISGRHPSGGAYESNDRTPLPTEFEVLKLPEGYYYVCDVPNDGRLVRKGPTTQCGVGDVSRSSEPSVTTGKRYPDEFIAGLRLRLPDYLKAVGTKLEQKGSYLVGHCPHPGHNDHKPSFGVFGDKHEMCRCFACDHTGDVFSTSQWLGRSKGFVEAVQDVAETLGVDLPLILDDEPQPAPFPLHCIPSVAGDMAREIARVTTSQNQPLAAASVLGILSASLGAGLEMSTGGERRTRGNLFILAIAASGTGKGEAFNLAAAPYEFAESEAMSEFEMREKPKLLAALRLAESRMKHLEKKAEREEVKTEQDKAQISFQEASLEVAKLQARVDAAPRMMVSDATKEALAKVMAAQPGEAIASLSSEARGVFSILKGRYGKEGGDEDFYCSAYSGESKPTDRVGRGQVILRRPCLSVLWMVQPDAARKAFGDEALTESGLLPRFLTFDPKAEPMERDAPPAPIPANVKKNWANLVTSLVDNHRILGATPRSVKVADDVYGIMLAYENENIRHQRSGPLKDMRSYAARWTENAWKMALVLHAAEHGSSAHEKELDATTARNAIEVVRWFVDKQLEILAAGRQQKWRARLTALLSALGDAGGEISLRDLRRSHGFEAEELKLLVDRYPSQLRVEKKSSGTGRPSEVLTTRLGERN